MKTKYGIAAGLALFSILVGLYFFVTRDDNQSNARKSSQQAHLAADPKPATNSPDETRTIPRPVNIAVSLPPATAPLSLVINDLKANAARGDARAACYLAIQLSKCQRLPNYKSADDKALTSFATSRAPVSESDVADLAEGQRRLTLDGKICAGIDAEQADQAWRYMVQSADYGNTAMAVEFIVRPPLDPDKPLDNIEGWKAYKERLGVYLEKGISKGNYQAIQLAYGLVSGQDSVLGMTHSPIPADPYKAVSYASILNKIGDPYMIRKTSRDLTQMKSELEPSRFERALANGNDLYQKSFLLADKSQLTATMDELTDPTSCSAN